MPHKLKTKQCNNYFDNARSSEIVFEGFSELKTVLPATKTSAPASNKSLALLNATPPSISIRVFRLAFVISFLSVSVFSNVLEMNFWPPKPWVSSYKRAIA